MLKQKLFWPPVKKHPLILGMWADLGVSEKYGDTYVIFISRVFGGLPNNPENK